MNALWLLIGALIGVAGYALVSKKGASLKPMDWIFVLMWVALLIFSVSVVTTLAAEPVYRHEQAALVSALIFGLITVVSGVFLFRRLKALK